MAEIIPESAPDPTRTEALRRRFRESFPVVGEFMWEDLETDAKREAFLDNEQVQKGRASVDGEIEESGEVHPE